MREDVTDVSVYLISWDQSEYVVAENRYELDIGFGGNKHYIYIYMFFVLSLRIIRSTDDFFAELLRKSITVCARYPVKYTQDCEVFCFVVVMLSVLMDLCDPYAHIRHAHFAGTGAIVC